MSDRCGPPHAPSQIRRGSHGVNSQRHKRRDGPRENQAESPAVRQGTFRALLLGRTGPAVEPGNEPYAEISQKWTPSLRISASSRAAKVAAGDATSFSWPIGDLKEVCHTDATCECHESAEVVTTYATYLGLA